MLQFPFLLLRLWLLISHFRQHDRRRQIDLLRQDQCLNIALIEYVVQDLSHHWLRDFLFLLPLRLIFIDLLVVIHEDDFSTEVDQADFRVVLRSEFEIESQCILLIRA